MTNDVMVVRMERIERKRETSKVVVHFSKEDHGHREKSTSMPFLAKHHWPLNTPGQKTEEKNTPIAVVELVVVVVVKW